VVLFDELEPAAAGVLVDQAREELGRRNFRVRGTDARSAASPFPPGWRDARQRTASRR
jgi:hypothetical protein